MSSLHAWVDESGSNRALDPDTYILAAAICVPETVEKVRDLMLSLRVKGTPKLHWRDETKPARRLTIARAVGECMDLQHLIVVRVGVPADTSRRPRQVALRELLLQLDRRDVGEVIFESRGRADDAKDIKVLRSLRDRHQAISPRLRINHAPGRTDAGLWVPDVVCGTVSTARTGEPEYFDLIKERAVVVTVDHAGHSLIEP